MGFHLKKVNLFGFHLKKGEKMGFHLKKCDKFEISFKKGDNFGISFKKKVKIVGFHLKKRFYENTYFWYILGP